MVGSLSHGCLLWFCFHLHAILALHTRARCTKVYSDKHKKIVVEIKSIKTLRVKIQLMRYQSEGSHHNEVYVRMYPCKKCMNCSADRRLLRMLDIKNVMELCSCINNAFALRVNFFNYGTPKVFLDMHP